jgi:hypothetical protein
VTMLKLLGFVRNVMLNRKNKVADFSKFSYATFRFIGD